MYLEEQIHKIYNPNTRDYMKEVISCYHNNNFRASVVTLYSVVIMDIYYKYDELAATNGVAREIIKKINGNDQENWENVILENVEKKKVDIFETEAINNLEYLQKLRNLCAHPHKSDDAQLYHPNKETVLACIVNMIEGVLKLPPMFTQNISKSIAEFLAEKKYVSKYDLEPMIEHLYLKRLNDTKLEGIFKSFWKYCFILDNDKANVNREINQLFLSILIDKKKELILQTIQRNQNNQTYKVHDNNEEILKSLVYFLANYPEIFQNLNEAVKADISSRISINNLGLIACFFKKKQTESMTEIFKHKIMSNDYQQVTFIKGKYENTEDYRFLKYFAEQYIKSSSFESNNRIFKNLIEPYISKYNLNDLQEMIAAFFENNQIYRANAAINQFKLFIEILAKKDGGKETLIQLIRKLKSVSNKEELYCNQNIENRAEQFQVILEENIAKYEEISGG